MTRAMFDKALDKIPALVAEMAAYYQEEGMYIELVERFTPSGSLYSRDNFVVTEATMLNHIERAHLKGFDITVDDTCVQVVRNLSNGERVVARYFPTESSGEVV